LVFFGAFAFGLRGSLFERFCPFAITATPDWGELRHLIVRDSNRHRGQHRVAQAGGPLRAMHPRSVQTCHGHDYSGFPMPAHGQMLRTLGTHPQCLQAFACASSFGVPLRCRKRIAGI